MENFTPSIDDFSYYMPFFKVVAILAVSLGFIKLERVIFKKIYPVLNAFIMAFSGLGILRVLGIPLSAIIAFGGVGGIAVGFAAKDLLANLFGSLMIFFDRQFKVGDWIRSPDRQVEGVVEYIGWRLTEIRTLEKRQLFVPNSLFSTITLENVSRMTHRRINVTLSLKPEDPEKIGKLLKEMEEKLRSHPKIDSKSLSYVRLVDFGPYSLQVEIYGFTKETNAINFQEVRQDLFLRMLDVISKNSCQFALTQDNAHLKNLSNDLPPG